MERRRLLQAAAVLPAVAVAPTSILTSFTRAAAATGSPVGRGTMVDAQAITGVSMSWTGGSDAPAAVVRALVDGVWGPDIDVTGDHGHGPEDPSGRTHGPPVMIDGAEAYWVAPGVGDDLRLHELPAGDRSLSLAADLSYFEPIPGLRVYERSSWTDRARKDTIDCTIGSSVLGLGCRSDVGLRHGVVHHTVNDNGYSEASVPSMLRGIQGYHMDTRGWDDIGYNFVIDRFGRVWHARAGDPNEPITGGHTLGLNTESVGVSVLGTFTSADVPEAVVQAIGMFMGWKLGRHGVDPLGTTIVRSNGGSYADRGEMVEVQNLSGHRDNQQTSCPGSKLYGRLDEIRANAAELVPVFGFATPTYSPESIRLEGWAMDRFNPTTTAPVSLHVDGGTPTAVTASLPVAGLAERYADAGANHGFDITVPITIDTTRVAITTAAGDGSTAELADLTLFATFVDVEADRFFAPGVYFMRKHGITNGTLPGLFEPMDGVNRAQMATFLHRFMDSPAATTTAPFTDLDDGSFYVDAVHWLAETGITTGTTDTLFSPDDPVTRGQMATFLWRLCGEIAATSPASFVDVPSRAFYAAAVAWMAETGVTRGVAPNRFAPDLEITRGEMATFLQRLATTPSAWTLTTPPSAVEI